MGHIPLGVALLLLALTAQAAPLPPLVCPAGGPIGGVDLRVASVRRIGSPLPLRTLNRLDEGDEIQYKPVLAGAEKRKGEVTLVLVPANPAGTGEKLLILDSKDADKPQQWKVPWRVAVVAYVYGPSGLNTRKVKNFLSRDEDLIAQLADYAEKTAQTEALLAALSSPTSSSANVQSALQGFSSQYGLNVQIDRNAPSNQQAMTLFRALNPAIASYDPITPQTSRQVGQTASLATSVATLFFGSPVGLAAGGTAMLLQLRSLAFPRSEFRSSFSQTMPNEELGLCGKRDPAPQHTKIAYLWASRIPNVPAPQATIQKPNFLPVALRSTTPIAVSDGDWRFLDRARNWVLQNEQGESFPVSVQKLGDTKTLEIGLGQNVKPGTYSLAANWDWDRFQVKGQLEVRPLSNFGKVHLAAASQDLLVAKTGKIPLTLEGGDFEFVTKVEVEKVNDKFASPAPAPFILPRGLRHGPQERMDIQLNTIDMDPGGYRLLLWQLDGKSQTVAVKVLPAPPTIQNLPVILNQGTSTVEFTLLGQRLDLVQRLEVPRGKAELGKPRGKGAERKLTLKMEPNIDAGTSLVVRAYIADRSEPLTFADAVRIVGPKPRITEISVAKPSNQNVQLENGELPGGAFLSAMMRVEHLQSNSLVRLACPQSPGSAALALRLGERSGASTLQRLAPGQLFLSFDSGLWPSGCLLQASVANGNEGESEFSTIGRIVRMPKIERFETAPEEPLEGKVSASLTGENLETIEKVGWNAEQPETVEGLPLPVGSDGQKQMLELRVAVPPDPQAPLYLWLRGESKPRVARVRP